ncbi:MAG TPA: hypothetical protein VE988_26820 [Gemmataceae bacterium]|nr:hypothetical protein [Gemmataceae bacterium]
MALTFAAIQPLLDQIKGDGSVVTCYADLSLIPGTPTRWPGVFKAKATAVKKMLGDDVTAWEQFEKNLQAIGKIVDAPQSQRAHAIAVFSAVQRGFIQTYPLDVPVENELVVHAAAYLVPLLQVLCRQRPCLVVHTNTHQGRLLDATGGSLHLLQEIEEEVPKHQHSAGTRRGMEQATIAARRDECIIHYQKKLVEAIDKSCARHAFQNIFLLGEHEQLEHLRKRLPSRLAIRVIHEGPHAWVDEPLAIADAVHTAQQELVQAEERRVLDTVKERRRLGYGLAFGANKVVDALQSGQLRPGGFGYLVLGPDPHEAVARCTACRSLFVEMPVTCPRCQAPCADGNLWEEIMVMALKHNIGVHCVRANKSLDQCGGIAAVLAETDRY